MAKVIGFENSPVYRLKRDLEEKEKECEALRAQARQATQKLVNVLAVNDMLKLQLADLQTNLQYLRFQVQSAETNIVSMKDKLPDLSGLQAAITSSILKSKLNDQEIKLQDGPANIRFDLEDNEKHDTEKD